MFPEDKMFECSNCEGTGFLPFPAGMSCYMCEGKGKVGEEEVNFVQGSFEQHGDPVEEPKHPVDFGQVNKDAPKMYMDMTGVGFIDKDGKKIPFGSEVHINLSDVIEHNEPINLGYKGEVTLNTPFKKDDDEFASKGIFEDFMDGVKAAETGRTPIRFLMIQEVDELLDLYNDYKQLYDMFKDKEHLEYMNGIKKVLKAKTKK